jgi:NADH-quinone oxidoreductase subunit L
MGLFGALLTAFYMMRLYSLTFLGTSRWAHDKHPHEAPGTMTIPLMILAGLSIVGGFIGLPASLGGGNWFEQWLEPVFERANMKLAESSMEGSSIEYVLMVVSVLVAVGGLLLARRWYLATPEVPEGLSRKFMGAYRLLLNKYYVDEAYDAAVVNPIKNGSEKILWKGIDVGVIDWCINTGSRMVAALSESVRVIQTGVTHSYMFVFVAGVVVILGWMLMR